MTRRYQLLLLSALVLAAYYPANFAGFSTVDDVSAFGAGHARLDWSTLKSLFMPSIDLGLYFRPMLVLSFLFDSRFLGLSPSLMHLENVLLHLLNAVLVYWILCSSLPSSGQKRSYVPFAASAVFGLHPLCTESVNWISGRTDVLATTFVLASTYCMIKYGERPSAGYLGLSIVTFMGGVLTKETAIAFLPGALILVYAGRQRQTGETASGRQEAARSNLKRMAVLTAALAMIVLVFLALREQVFVSHSNRVAITIRSIAADWTSSLFVMLRTIGFYFKKLVAPYPLNFAIVEIDPLYEIAAVPLVALSIYIMTKGTAASRFFLAGVLLIVPALVIAFGQIAWTSYAERYLYLPLAFMTIAAAHFIAGRSVTLPSRSTATILAVLLTIIFFTVVDRSMLWQNDGALLKDTAEKSPASQDAQYAYGRYLAGNGNFQESLKYLERARSLPVLEYRERIDLALVYVYSKLYRTDDAITVAMGSLRKTKFQSGEMLGNLITLLEEKKRASSNVRERQRIERSVEAYTNSLMALNADPRILYHLGTEAATRGAYGKAKRLYQAAYDKMGDHDEYRIYARNKIMLLTRRTT